MHADWRSAAATPDAGRWYPRAPPTTVVRTKPATSSSSSSGLSATTQECPTMGSSSLLQGTPPSSRCQSLLTGREHCQPTMSERPTVRPRRGRRVRPPLVSRGLRTGRGCCDSSRCVVSSRDGCGGRGPGPAVLRRSPQFSRDGELGRDLAARRRCRRRGASGCRRAWAVGDALGEGLSLGDGGNVDTVRGKYGFEDVAGFVKVAVGDDVDRVALPATRRSDVQAAPSGRFGGNVDADRDGVGLSAAHSRAA